MSFFSQDIPHDKGNCKDQLIVKKGINQDQEVKTLWIRKLNVEIINWISFEMSPQGTLS